MMEEEDKPYYYKARALVLIFADLVLPLPPPPYHSLPLHFYHASMKTEWNRKCPANRIEAT